MMISNVRGEFTRASGTAPLNEKDVAGAKVEVSIEGASINTREPDRGKHPKSGDFFDAEKFSQIRFQSKKITRGADGELTLTVDLTIRDGTKEISLEVEEMSPQRKDPWKKDSPRRILANSAQPQEFRTQLERGHRRRRRAGGRANETQHLGGIREARSLRFRLSRVHRIQNGPEAPNSLRCLRPICFPKGGSRWFRVPARSSSRASVSRGVGTDAQWRHRPRGDRS